jgi:hypothetical protein
MVVVLPIPVPETKRAASLVGSGFSTRGLVKVLYGVDAAPWLLSLGIPQICTSDMARRD